MCGGIRCTILSGTWEWVAVAAVERGVGPGEPPEVAVWLGFGRIVVSGVEIMNLYVRESYKVDEWQSKVAIRTNPRCGWRTARCATPDWSGCAPGRPRRRCNSTAHLIPPHNPKKRGYTMRCPRRRR